MRMETAEYRAYIAANELPQLYSDGCHASLSETQPKLCFYGDPKAVRTIVLFGDSNAAHWFPPLDDLARKHGWLLVPLTKAACPAALIEPYSAHFGRQYRECTEWRERAIALITEHKPELLIVSNLELRSSEWDRAMHDLLERVSSDRGRVVVLGTIPFADLSPSDCVADPKRSGCFARVIEHDPIDDVPLNVSMADLSAIVCPATPCPVIDGEIVKYRDARHLSVAYSRMLAPHLAELLRLDDSGAREARQEERGDVP